MMAEPGARRAGTVRAVMTIVLGAPGSGKTTVAPLLRGVLTTHVVVDWDACMPAASELANRDVSRSPTTWPAYRGLMRTVVETIQPAPLVLLGVCTPDELEGWPITSWILLDCSDDERRRRLAPRFDAADIDAALTDATRYRALSLPVVDTTNRTAMDVAGELAALIRTQINAG
jgi:hypothetical protein